MRTPRNADRLERQSRADSAVATIWLIFYVQALGAAITLPFIQDMSLAETPCR